MRTRFWILLLGAAFFLEAGVSFAQVSGLPTAGTADPLGARRRRGSIGAMGGFGLSAGKKFDDSERSMFVYGGRLEYGFRGGWEAFADAGLLDPEDADTGMGFQLGAQYSLDRPWEPYDLAIRGSAGWSSFSDDFGLDFTWITLSLNALISKPMDAWTPYGVFGVRLLREEEKLFGYTEDRWLVAPAIGIGTTYDLTRHFSLYGEVSYVGGVWVAGGLRRTF